jgi:hypothetical protein
MRPLWLRSLERPAELVIAPRPTSNPALCRDRREPDEGRGDRKTVWSVNWFMLEEGSPLHRKRAGIAGRWLCRWDIFPCEILTD